MNNKSLIRTREILLYLSVFITVIFSMILFIRTIYIIQIEDYELYKNKRVSNSKNNIKNSFFSPLYYYSFIALYIIIAPLYYYYYMTFQELLR